MIAIETIRKIAFSFEGAVESPYSDKTSFRIKKKDFCYSERKRKPGMYQTLTYRSVRVFFF